MGIFGVKKNRSFTAAAPSEEKQTESMLPRIGIVLFVSLWTFFLGVLVGRGTAPVQFDIQGFERKLAAIKEIRVAEEQKQYNVDIDSLVNKPELGFHEALESPGEDAMLKVQPPVSPATDESGEAEPASENTGEETPEAGSAESLLQPPLVKKQRFPKPESLKTAENVVSLENAEQKRSPKAPSPKPAAAKLSAAEDRLRKLTIQIGSFQDENAAKRRVDELKTLGYAAYQSAGKIPQKGTWHRVRIGEFNSRDAAGPVLESLRKKKIRAIIVSLKN